MKEREDGASGNAWTDSLTISQSREINLIVLSDVPTAKNGNLAQSYAIVPISMQTTL